MEKYIVRQKSIHTITHTLRRREKEAIERNTFAALEWTILNQHRTKFCLFNPMKIFVPFETYTVRLTFVKVWNWE